MLCWQAPTPSSLCINHTASYQMCIIRVKAGSWTEKGMGKLLWHETTNLHKLPLQCNSLTWFGIRHCPFLVRPGARLVITTAPQEATMLRDCLSVPLYFCPENSRRLQRRVSLPRSPLDFHIHLTPSCVLFHFLVAVFLDATLISNMTTITALASTHRHPCWGWGCPAVLFLFVTKAAGIFCCRFLRRKCHIISLEITFEFVVARIKLLT